jgi:hypothetical protein
MNNITINLQIPTEKYGFRYFVHFGSIRSPFNHIRHPYPNEESDKILFTRLSNINSLDKQVRTKEYFDYLNWYSIKKGRGKLDYKVITSSEEFKLGLQKTYEASITDLVSQMIWKEYSNCISTRKQKPYYYKSMTNASEKEKMKEAENRWESHQDEDKRHQDSIVRKLKKSKIIEIKAKKLKKSFYNENYKNNYDPVVDLLIEEGNFKVTQNITKKIGQGKKAVYELQSKLTENIFKII